MARNQNTFEKQRREMEKKRKAEDKRARRKQRKDDPNADAVHKVEDDEQAKTGGE